MLELSLFATLVIASTVAMTAAVALGLARLDGKNEKPPAIVLTLAIALYAGAWFTSQVVGVG